MIWRSISAHALLRALSPTISSALAIAALIEGTLSCGQFELKPPLATMLSPLKVASSIVCGSLKSFSQPTFGQMITLAFGSPQNLVYIVSCVTRRSFGLKPSFSNCVAANSAPFCAAPPEVPTISSSSLPVYIPDGKPPFFMYSFASVRSPFGFARKSTPVPSKPPASSNPPTSGGMKWLAIGPSSAPPRVARIASRSNTASTALRTLRLLNGASDVLSDT